MRMVPKGAFAGLLHVTVDRISGVSDSAGFMDKTDPYVSLCLATETLRTSCLDNAGGDARFNETLTFQSKPLMDGKLIVQVFDKDTLRYAYNSRSISTLHWVSFSPLLGLC